MSDMKTMKLRNFQGNLVEYREVKDTFESGGCDSCALRNKPECAQAIYVAVEAFGANCSTNDSHYEVVE